MSFKIERDTFQQQGAAAFQPSSSQFQQAASQFQPNSSQLQQAANQFQPPQPSTGQKLLHPIRTAERALVGPQIPGTSGHHPIAEVVGTALTGGRQNAGTKGYLAVCKSKNTVWQLARKISQD